MEEQEQDSGTSAGKVGHVLPRPDIYCNNSYHIVILITLVLI